MSADLEDALKILDDGGVVGMPTETVYGLAARIDRPEGLRRIFETKERPFFDPLIVHVASLAQARECASEWSPVSEALAADFWPGPLTVVVPKSAKIPAVVTSGLETVGLRSPAHPLALELISKAGPLAAPSANRFGRTSPSRADHVREEFENRVTVLDGGPCAVGIESTIVSVESDGTLRLLRPGKVGRPEISRSLEARNLAHRWEEARKALAPGMMRHHYMPAIPLVVLENEMSEQSLRENLRGKLEELPETVEGVRMIRPSGVSRLGRMELGSDPLLAARDLYQALRESAQASVDVIYLVWPSDRRSGPWEAVWDRLRKAASLHLS